MTATADRPSGASASRGAGVTILGQIVRIVVQLAGIMILARLLTPERLRSARHGDGDHRRGRAGPRLRPQLGGHPGPHPQPGQKNNLFWINASIGLALMLLTIGASWLIADFYDDSAPPADHGSALRHIPAQRPVDPVPRRPVALTAFRASRRRGHRRARWSRSRSDLGLAFAGAGYWSLVGQSVAQTVAALVVLDRSSPAGSPDGCRAASPCAGSSATASTCSAHSCSPTRAATSTRSSSARGSARARSASTTGHSSS